jgi:hypothetical protein
MEPSYPHRFIIVNHLFQKKGKEIDLKRKDKFFIAGEIINVKHII